MAASDDLLNQWKQEQQVTAVPVGDKPTNTSGSDALLSQWKNDLESNITISIQNAAKGNPERAAEVQKIARSLYVPTDTVEKNWDDLNAFAKTRVFQMQRDAAEDPVLARMYANPDFAAIGYDDYSNIAGAGKAVRNLGKPAERTVVETLQDIGVTGLKGAMGLNQTIIGLLDIPTKGWVGKQIQGLGLDFKEAQDIAQSMYSPATQQAAQRFAQADGVIDKAAAAIENPSVIATTVGESLPSMFLGGAFAKSLGALRGLAASPLTRVGIGEGAVTAGQIAEQVRSENPSGELTTGQVMAALAAGGGTGLLGMLGAKVAQRLGITDLEAYVAGVNTANPAKQKMIGRQILEGAAAEGVLEELPQSIQEQMWQNIAQEKPVFDGVDDAAVLGLFAGMAMGGGGPIVAYPANIRAEREAARMAEQKAQVMDLIAGHAAASEVLRRDPESFQNYIEQVSEAGDIQSVFIKASVLQQLGLTEAISEVIPSVGEQLRQAVSPDQEVQISVADYAAKIATTEANAALLDNIRVEGESMTRAEATAFIENESETLQKAYDKSQKTQQTFDEFKKSSKAVESEVLGQLNQIGAFAKADNKVQASLYSKIFSMLALRLNQTPEQVYQQYKTSIMAEGQAQAGQVLNQVNPASPEFMSWYANSVFKDAEGKPQLLYHGTADDVQEFDLNHPNRKDTGWLGTGVYLTDSTDMADAYARQKKRKGGAAPNVMPLYAKLENPYMATDDDKARVKAGGKKAADAFTKQLKEAGYDGIIYQAAPDAKEIVVFDTAAVKSALNKTPTEANGLFRQSAAVDQTKTANFKRWSNDAPFVSSEEAEKYGFNTGSKIVVDAFHGTGRPDRIGTAFKKSRATSGPMSFFTSSPVLASSYAEGKQDTSLAYEDGNYANWFKYKPKGQRSASDIVRAWYSLNPETKAKITEMAPKLRLSEDANSVIVEEGNARGNGSYDYNYQQTKRRGLGGNPLEALVEDWLNSGNLFDNEELFMDVLKKAGFPVNDVTYDSPNATYPGVYRVYIQMQKPLVTNDIPAEVIDALKAAAKRDRSRAAQGGADMWDKNTRTLREWVAEFEKPDNAYVWTSIPDKVTKVFESLGYDGIVDWSGKGGGSLAAPVYIPFNETQVKSAIGNRGTFDPSKKNILQQQTRGYIDPKNLMVILTPEADRSTPGHELAHAVVEIYTRIANTENAPAEIVSDLDKLLEFAGVQGATQQERLAGWSAMTLDEQRPFHEAIAYNWEIYLAEGKAPSVELQSVFDRLSQWIRDLYVVVRDKLNDVYKAEFGKDLPVMEDGVREVFDRMLASQEQIAQAETVRNMQVLFESKPEGMDDAQWAALQQMAEEARDASISKLTQDSLRQMRWLSNAKMRVIKQMQRENAALRAEVQQGVEAEIKKSAIYKAINFIKDGIEVLPDGTTRETAGLHKISIAGVREIYGENRPAKNRFMDFLVQHGVSVKDRSDVGGDKGGKYRPGLFRNDGLRLDELAYVAYEEGYLTEADMQSEKDTGGVNKLADLIQRALGGERILTAEQQMAQDERDVKAQQREQAAAFDAFGEENAVDEADAMRAMGYSEAEIASMLASPDWRKLGFGKYGMLAAEGLHPDALAEQLGFGSGDELIRTLIATPSFKEAVRAETDARMLAEYGDMNDKREVDLAVERALHNEARARFVAAQLRFVSRATAPARAMIQAAKRAAQNIIGDKLIKDLKPSEYGIAEARANKEAIAAQKAGDDQAVTKAMQSALVNNQLAEVAADTRSQIDSDLAYLRNVTSDANRKRIGADHADQIDSMLARFDLSAPGNRIKTLAQWLESQREAGYDPEIAQEILDEAYRKPYKLLTVKEFRDLLDAVRQIEHLGRNEQNMLTAAKETAYKAARDEIVESVGVNARGRTADVRTAKTKIGKMVQGLQRFMAEHIKAATIARILDGGKEGPVWEYLIRPANAAADRETAMRAEATLDITRIMAPILNGMKPGKGTLVPSIGRALNKEERVAIALNMGNQSNMQRLLDGEGWTIQQVMPVLESLTAAELEAVQQIWDYSETKHKPLIAEQWRRLYGREPNWIDPTPLTVKSADGKTVELRGGYYPVVYDPRASQRAGELYDAEQARMEMQGFISATISTSFAKGRVQMVKERPLLLSLTGVYNGINEVIHALAWQEFIIDANRLLRSYSIDQAIRTTYGPEYKSQLKGWVKDVAVGERAAAEGGAQAINFVRQSVSAAGLGFNIMSALQQVTGFSSSIVKIGAGYVGRGIAKTMASPSAAIKEVYGKSTFMANRGRTQFRELNELRNMVQGETKVARGVKVGTYFMMAQMQRMVDIPTWIGAYEKAIGEGNDEDRAIALADQSVIDSQGGGMLKDLSKIERGGPWLKLFTVFYSYMGTQFNLATAEAMTERSKGKLAAKMLMLTVVPVVLAYAIKHGLTPDDDDEWDWEKISKDLITENISYLMGMMILVRELGSAAKIAVGTEGGNRGYSGPAGVRMISDLYSFATQAKQGDFDDAFRKAAINLLGDFTGLPSAQINRTINGVDALIEGKTSNPAAVLTGFEKK